MSLTIVSDRVDMLEYPSGSMGHIVQMLETYIECWMDYTNRLYVEVSYKWMETMLHINMQVSNSANAN